MTKTGVLFIAVTQEDALLLQQINVENRWTLNK